MMKGNNKIIVNESAMMQIIQAWMGDSSCRYCDDECYGVTHDVDAGEFIINIREKAPEGTE